jgi:hypothetical protein
MCIRDSLSIESSFPQHPKVFYLSPEFHRPFKFYG